MIGIIGALDIEVKSLISGMTDTEEVIISDILYTKGVLKGKECVVAKSGVGKVNAAICAQTMILKFSPDYIINTGVAGSLSENIEIGDIVVADCVIQHDVDTSALGDPKGMISGINMIKIPCSPKILEDTIKIAKQFHCKDVYEGTILSGDQFISNRDELVKLNNKFSGLACEMEGGSIGQVCYINNVDFIIIRSISDSANESSPIDYSRFIKFAAERSAHLVEKLVENRVN